MKIRKEPIREDRYLNVKLDTYSIDFTAFDSIFYDLGKFAYCIIISDGENEVFLEYSGTKPDALQKHKEYYERLLLRPNQWFDVRKKKFCYLNYKDNGEKITDIITIAQKDLYTLFVKDIQHLIVRGSNNGLTFYTKREATDYSRKVGFSIFSGLRVKIGQLRNTSYADLKQNDAKEVESLVKQTDKELAEIFLNAMYNPDTEEHERWEMFVDLVEAKISEYYREGNRSTNEAPNYIILEKILKEIDARISISPKKAATTGPVVKAKPVEKTSVPVKAPVPVKPSAPAEPVTRVMVDTVKQLDNAGATKPEDKAKELEEIKTLLGLVSEEKLIEIKALLKSVTLEQQKSSLESANAAPAVEYPAPPEAAPAVQETTATGAGLLPATSPNGSKVYPENVPGLFYVDENCIECDACTGEAPNFFVIENGHAHVFAQPTNEKEIAECNAAMEGCPVDAIHKNE